VNFADAIRQAAQQSGGMFSVPEPQSKEETVVDTVDTKARGNQSAEPTLKLSANAGDEAVQPQAADQEDTPVSGAQEFVNAPEPPSPHVMTGSVVRLELFLSPEQLNGLFRAVVANQHSVMTLREAASFLRIPASRLEKMAQDGEIPALQIDGRWRFTRSAVDEWMTFQSAPKEIAS
jgi:excisionase family DNA binding protein